MDFKFPSLDQVVSKSKSLANDDIKQYIFVCKGHAITFDTPVFIVNLYEYVKNECKLEEEDDLEELETILNYLEGKAIPASAWKVLTSKSDVTFDRDNEEIIINNVGHKSALMLKENNIGIQYFKHKIKQYVNLLKADSIKEESQAYNGHVLTFMSSVFKNEIKTDTVLLTRCAGTSTVKYQLNGKPYIFGLLNIDDDVNSLMKNLTSEMHISDLVDVLESSIQGLKFEEPKKEEVQEEEKPHPFMNEQKDIFN